MAYVADLRRHAPSNAAWLGINAAPLLLAREARDGVQAGCDVARIAVVANADTGADAALAEFRAFTPQDFDGAVEAEAHAGIVPAYLGRLRGWAPQNSSEFDEILKRAVKRPAN